MGKQRTQEDDERDEDMKTEPCGDSRTSYNCLRQLALGLYSLSVQFRPSPIPEYDILVLFFLLFFHPVSSGENRT